MHITNVETILEKFLGEVVLTFYLGTKSLQLFIKKHKISIISIFFILMITVLLTFPLRDTFSEMIFLSDDAVHISVGNSLASNHGFFVDFQSTTQPTWSYVKAWHKYWDTAELTELFKAASTPLSGKGPIHYLFLGLIFQKANATPDNWYYLASLVSTIFTLIFLTLSFIFCKRHFGLNVAIVSTFIISILTITVVYSSRVLQYPVVSTFILAAFLFTEKTKRDYILFGFFAGLSHLTHPIGIVAIISYSIFLLLKKEFKGAGLVVSIWFLTLLPWFIRNVFVFGGFGYGFYIPYSDKISTFLGLQRFAEFPVEGRIGGQFLQVSDQQPFEVFYGLFTNEIIQNYHMVTAVFILFCIVLSFISFSGLKFTIVKFNKKPKTDKLKIITIFFAVTFTFFILWNFFGTDFPVQEYRSEMKIQIFIFFLLPIMVGINLYLFNKNIFEKRIKRIHIFILIFAIISLVVYFQYSLNEERDVPELKIILPLFYVGIPLGVYGFEKFIQLILKKIPISNIKLATLIGLLIILGIPSIIELSWGYDLWLNEKFAIHEEQPSMKKMHSWIRENLDDVTVIASDLPAAVFLETGEKSVEIAVFQMESERVYQNEKFFEYFDVSHIVLYYDWKTTLFDQISTKGKYYYEKIYDDPGDEESQSIGRHYKIYEIRQITEDTG